MTYPRSYNRCKVKIRIQIPDPKFLDLISTLGCPSTQHYSDHQYLDSVTLNMGINSKLIQGGKPRKTKLFMSEVFRQIMELIIYSKIMQMIFLVVN